MAAAVLTFGGFAEGAGRAAADSVPPFVTVGAIAVPYDGPQPWSDASISSRTSTALTVYATGWADGGGPCGPPVLRFQVTESASAVEVLVAAYQAPSTLVTACAAVGYLPGPHTLHLRRPLGSRAVIDAATGHRAALLDGARHPDLPRVPPGLQAQPLQRWREGASVVRSWTAPGTPEPLAISLSDQAPSSVRSIGPSGRIVQQTDVHGTPATVYRGVGTSPGTWFVQWTPNPRQTITLTVATAGTHRWSAASALAVARSVTRYATERTDRLGTPMVGGTLAATYSSADGPLRNAENLLKSSGVYVALDCAGAGRLTVTVRDRAHRFTCTTALGHHRFTSVGAPDEVFTVSVNAPTRVRWALALARRSLDGS